VSESDERVPAAMKETHGAVVGLTDAFCREHLDAEYAVLCRKLSAALSRKRPSPLSRGDVRSWACGIVHVLGRVNFLFDRTQTPHVSQGDLVRLFDVSTSTATSRSRLISRLLNMIPLDPRWSLPSRLDDNPLAWFVEVNGFVVDARDLPRSVQEEVHRRGLIPYVPKQPHNRAVQPTASAPSSQPGRRRSPLRARRG